MTTSSAAVCIAFYEKWTSTLSPSDSLPKGLWISVGVPVLGDATVRPLNCIWKLKIRNIALQNASSQHLSCEGKCALMTVLPHNLMRHSGVLLVHTQSQVMLRKCSLHVQEKYLLKVVRSCGQLMTYQAVFDHYLFFLHDYYYFTRFFFCLASQPAHVKNSDCFLEYGILFNCA